MISATGGISGVGIAAAGLFVLRAWLRVPAEIRGNHELRSRIWEAAMTLVFRGTSTYVPSIEHQAVVQDVRRALVVAYGILAAVVGLNAVKLVASLTS